MIPLHQRRPRRTQSKKIRNILLASSIILAFTVAFYLLSIPSQPSGMIYNSPNGIPLEVVKQLDAILVLGGGVPSSITQPPVYVQKRCDDAAEVIHRRKEIIKEELHVPILCLSAGTAHLPQLLSADGLPVWEATSSAAYLEEKHGLTNTFVETTSYDTIGNAFYARTSHTDVAGWRNLLIITNEFHMPRSKAIFDWIFGLDTGQYKLFYLQSENVGLTVDAVDARKEREAKSLESVEKFAKEQRTLKDVWHFLNTNHGLYTASKLISRGKKAHDSEANALVKKSYGAS